MNPPTDRDRIESLARSGHLSRRDAEKILAALDAIESERAAAEHGPAERTPIVVVGFPRLRVRYALGELSEEAFRTAVRVQWTLLSVVSGLLFAVLMGLTHFFWLGKIAWLAWAIMGVVFGVLSGLVLYYVQIRPQVDKLVEFCREAGRPTRPLSDGRCGQCPCCGAENSTEFSWPHPVVMRTSN